MWYAFYKNQIPLILDYYYTKNDETPFLLINFIIFTNIIHYSKDDKTTKLLFPIWHNIGTDKLSVNL